MDGFPPRRIARSDPYDRILVQESLAAIARAGHALRDADAILARRRHFTAAGDEPQPVETVHDAADASDETGNCSAPISRRALSSICS